MPPLPEFEHHAATVAAVRAPFLSILRQMNDTNHTKQAAVIDVDPFLRQRVSKSDHHGSRARYDDTVLQQGESLPAAVTCAQPTSRSYQAWSAERSHIYTISI